MESAQHPRLLDLPEPPTSAVEHEKRHAWLILKSAIAKLNPTRDPASPTRWFSIPLAAGCLLPFLSPSAQALYVGLWRLTGRFRKGLPNTWFWCTDTGPSLQRPTIHSTTGLSPRSLARARTALRDSGAAYITTAGPEQVPTWYALRWPLDIPAAADRSQQIIMARELLAGGEPWAPLHAWAALALAVLPGETPKEVRCPRSALAQRVVTALSPPGRPHLLRRALSDLQAADPWLLRQLNDWALPDACPRSSTQTSSSGSAQPSRISTPETAPPSS